MEGSTLAAQAPSQTQSQNHGNRRGQHRRPRGGQTRTSALSMRPASVAPPDHSSDDPGSTSEAPRHNTRSQGRGGRASKPRMVNGRQFGGQLTSEGVAAPNSDLQADAAVFTPGAAASAIHANRPGRHQQPPRKRRLSKSQAPDIATRTHEDIDNAQYECPICTSEVQRNSKVWSCHTCWTVFHLTCVKKWSTNQGSSAAQHESSNGGSAIRQWRCPGCNLPKDTLPKSYTCWCEKETDPRPLAGLPPHSCGQSCGRERVRKCPHPCQLTCHAGPCPPCTHMGPTQMCFCGKHETTKRCSETDYQSGWSCGELCGELMPCGEHLCPRPCHEGLCGACEVRIPAKCYCGQVEKDVVCAERADDVISSRTHTSSDGEDVTETWTGIFECSSTCERAFDCGVHRCQKPCHAQVDAATHCPRSPDLVTHCPCGKTPLSAISEKPRSSCTDDIPSCQEPCNKTLPCGHTCTEICHTGPCSSCMEVVSIVCRCGRTTSSTICHQGHEERPQCMRLCRQNLNCGRHACDERCCTGERKAIERQGQKRKQRPLGSAPRPIDDGFEAEHICTRQCGRLLKCGTHICEELCHKGPCGSCREAIFDEISCHCGRTVLQPPLPCGTEPPPCRYQCTRLKACSHPQVPHVCHGDDATCPKCPYLMEKACMCGKRTLKNQQCWLQDVRCGEICGKRLRCGSHTCRKACHRPGECEDAHGAHCQQPCGKPKSVCGHPDAQRCHAPFACEEDKPCQSKIFIMCECQAQKQEAKCGASRTSSGNLGKVLPCNEECARLERNRKLALALNIDQTAHIDGGDHVPYSTETLSVFASQIKWCQTQEREFRVFATSDNERRMRFPPMKSNQRAFLHHLAEDFGFDSESMDPEPHRHVMIWKTPRFVSAPNKTLAEALRIRQAQRALVPSAPTSDTERPMRAAVGSAKGQPYNGFLVTQPRFGLTIEELRTELDSVSTAPLSFSIEFLPSEEVVIKADFAALAAQDVQQQLINLRPALAAAIAGKQYGAVQLCTADGSLNIIRRESDDLAAQDGWSRVAAKKVAPRTLVQNGSTPGMNNQFAALSGNKITFSAKKAVAKKAKPIKEDVVEDWESFVRQEEENERASGVESGDAQTAEVGSMTDLESTITATSPMKASPEIETLSGLDTKTTATNPPETLIKVEALTDLKSTITATTPPEAVTEIEISNGLDTTISGTARTEAQSEDPNHVEHM